MEKTSNRVPKQRDPIDIICGVHNSSGQYICIAKDGSSACDQERHSWEDAKNWTCCDGTGFADYAAKPCPNPTCVSAKVARLA